MKLKWTRLAAHDLESATNYFEREAPEAIHPVLVRIEAATRMLLSWPLAGRVGRIFGTREWVVQDTSYIIAYRVAGDVLVILRVLHSRQRWPRRIG